MTISTILVIILAANLIIAWVRVHYWTQRTLRSEASMARVEREIVSPTKLDNPRRSYGEVFERARLRAEAAYRTLEPNVYKTPAEIADLTPDYAQLASKPTLSSVALRVAATFERTAPKIIPDHIKDFKVAFSETLDQPKGQIGVTKHYRWRNNGEGFNYSLSFTDAINLTTCPGDVQGFWDKAFALRDDEPAHDREEDA